MARSFDQSHHTRGGCACGDYHSARMGGGYPPAGRRTKVRTHRWERRVEAKRTIAEQLTEVLFLRQLWRDLQ